MKIITHEAKEYFLKYDLLLRLANEQDYLKKILNDKQVNIENKNEFGLIIDRINNLESEPNSEIYNINYIISLKSIHKFIVYFYKDNYFVQNNNLIKSLEHVLDILEMKDINYRDINNLIFSNNNNILKIKEINNIVSHLTIVKDLIKIISKNIPTESNFNSQFEVIFSEFLSLILDIDILQRSSGFDDEGNIFGYDVFEAINNSFQKLFMYSNFSEAVFLNELIINFTFYSRILSLLFSKIKMKKFITENSSEMTDVIFRDGSFELIITESNYKIIFISDDINENKKIFVILNKKNIHNFINSTSIFKKFDYKTYKNLPNNLFWCKLYNEIENNYKIF